MSEGRGSLPPPYSALPERPAWKWPGERGLATWVVVNIEHFEFGKLGPAIQPHLTSQPEIANYAWRDYGNRVGIWRLFDLFDRYPAVRVTAALNADICRLYPAIVEGVLARGWEIMAHGLNNSRGQAGLEVSAEGALIAETLDVIKEFSGQRPVGWLTPGFSVTSHTPELLHRAGITYLADWVNDDQPYFWPVESGQLTMLPYSLETNDISLFLSQRVTGPEFSQAVRDQFAQLETDSATASRVFALGLHPFLVGQPLRLRYLEEVLQIISNSPATWRATGANIAAYYANLFSPDPL